MKILYLSFTNTRYSSNATHIGGLRKCGVEVVTYFPPAQNWRKYPQIARFYFQNRKGAGFLIVGNDCPKLVIFLKIISRRPIIYNALCSVYERLIVSRVLTGRRSFKAFYYWLLDFFASHLSNLVMLESGYQIEYFSQLFLLKKTKCFLAWTGTDEELFFFDPQVEKTRDFMVIFRGRLLPEAGAEVAVEAAKILEPAGVKVLMYASGIGLPRIQSLIKKLQPSNLELVTDFLPIEQIREVMQSAHLSLGQLSAHPRLSRTVPHKAYESLVLKTAYLTARNEGVLELLRENGTCLAFNPGDARDLADKILWAKGHPVELARIANNAYELYQSHLTEKHLANRLLERLRSINSRFV